MIQQVLPRMPALTVFLSRSGVHFQGKYEEALPVFERSLDIRVKTLGDKHSAVATALGNLAWLLYAKVRFATVRFVTVTRNFLL